MTNFQGFNTPDGFTQIPNEYLEYTYSHECDLTLVDIKIMNLFFRNTFGWFGKQQYGIVLSLTEIQMIINNKNKNQVSRSLQKLVEKNFLEKKLVSELTKKQKSNIEKSLHKTLKSNQVIYRLKLKDNPLPWDLIVNVEDQMGKEKIDGLKESFYTSIKSDTGIKIDTDTSIKSDTGSSIKIDTSEDVESFETLSVSDSLNKGLNKDLNKKEEEEETITLQKVISFMNEQISKRQITNPKTLTAIFEVAAKCKAIGTDDIKSMENYCITIVEEKMSKFGQKQRELKRSKGNNNHPIHKEVLPEWFEEGSQIMDKPKKKSKEEIEQSKQVIEDMLKRLKA